MCSSGTTERLAVLVTVGQAGESIRTTNPGCENVPFPPRKITVVANLGSVGDRLRCDTNDARYMYCTVQLVSV